MTREPDPMRDPDEPPAAPDAEPEQEPLPTPDTGDYPAPGGPPEGDDTTQADPPAERRYGES